MNAGNMPAFSAGLEDELSTFCSIVEVAMCDPSEKIRNMFQYHLQARYPCVERLFEEQNVIYAAVRNSGVLHQVPVMYVPETYLGERPFPHLVDVAALRQ